MDDINSARKVVSLVSVQNRYNLVDRSAQDVLDLCEREDIGFIPWAPIDAGQLSNPGGPVDRIATETGASASQVALSWLLARSPVILPIPGTSTVRHLEDNCSAAGLRLTVDQAASLESANNN